MLNKLQNLDLDRRNKDRKKRRNHLKSALKNAASKAQEALYEDLTQKHYKQLLKDGITSTSHLGNIGWEFFKSHYDFRYLNNPKQRAHHEKIIKYVATDKQLDPIRFEQSDIFHAIFNELKLYAIDPQREKLIAAPHVDATIVLLSGVFNEFFHQADFERGVRSYCNRTNVEYIVPKLSGVKSSLHNTKLLEQQLFEYTKANPNKKLWIIAYSKGGIDLLHFLKKNSQFAKDKIIGASMLAVPILGTSHLEKKRVKLINLIQKIPHQSFQELINKYGIVLSPEFQIALDSNYRASWFKRNYENIPEELFYTSLAFDSTWREGHAWMKLTKIILNTKQANDGIVETSNGLFPDYFFGINLGVERGHHLVGMHSSAYPQEELIEAHIIYLKYVGVL